MKRHRQNKEYGEIKKCKSPACCSMRCCGNNFGIIGASNHVRNGAKKKIRRYFRHASKHLIYKLIVSELIKVE